MTGFIHGWLIAWAMLLMMTGRLACHRMHWLSIKTSWLQSEDCKIF